MSYPILLYFILIFIIVFDTANTAVFRVLCSGSHHMRTLAEEVIQKGGGEGLILRRVASHYEPGRSLSLLKLKVRSLLIQVLFLLFVFFVLVV